MLLRSGNTQVLADFSGQQVVHFGVAWNSGAPVFGEVAPPRVIATFADQLATVLSQVLNQRAPFHRLDRDQLLGEIFLRGLAGLLPVEFEGFFQDDLE